MHKADGNPIFVCWFVVVVLCVCECVFTVANGFAPISSTKPWSVELDPVTSASDLQELFPPKPKPKSGILDASRQKASGRWRGEGVWG